jgi:hypothetical protein
LADALKLEKENKAVVLSDSYLVWSCRKKESFISIELNELNKKILFFEKKIDKLEKASIKQNAMAFSLHLDQDPEFNFFSGYKDSLKELFSSIPFLLSSFSTAFFDPLVSNSINCIFSSVLSRFREFSRSNSTSSFISKDSILIDSCNPLNLLTEFSKNENIPVPKLVLLGENA